MITKPKPKKCRHCETAFMPYRSTDKYCSPKCAVTAGVNHAKRVSDVKERYSKPRKNYREPAARKDMKTRAKERDNYRCLLYGYAGHMCDFRREAHHILYVSEGGPDRLWNLITLCGFAHHEIAHKDKKIQPYLLEVVNGLNWFDRIDRSNLSETVLVKLNYLRQLSGQR